MSAVTWVREYMSTALRELPADSKLPQVVPVDRECRDAEF
jgi:hypothetical protein